MNTKGSVCRKRAIKHDEESKKENSSKDVNKEIKSFQYLQPISCIKFDKFDNVVKTLYEPTWPSSLGVIRAMFGKKSKLFNFSN